MLIKQFLTKQIAVILSHRAVSAGAASRPCIVLPARSQAAWLLPSLMQPCSLCSSSVRRQTSFLLSGRQQMHRHQDLDIQL